MEKDPKGSNLVSIGGFTIAGGFIATLILGIASQWVYCIACIGLCIIGVIVLHIGLKKHEQP